MTVKELKDKLDKFPDNLPVIIVQKEMSNYYEFNVSNAIITSSNGTLGSVYEGKPVIEII